jgi:hypothetical protein
MSRYQSPEEGSKTNSRNVGYMKYILDNGHLVDWLFIPVAPTWSTGHAWNASFRFSLLIYDIRYDSLDEWSPHRKAAT